MCLRFWINKKGRCLGFSPIDASLVTHSLHHTQWSSWWFVTPSNKIGFVYPFYPRFRAQWFRYLLSWPTWFRGQYHCSDSGNRTHSEQCPPLCRGFRRLSLNVSGKLSPPRPSKRIVADAIPVFMQGHHRYVAGRVYISTCTPPPTLIRSTHKVSGNPTFKIDYTSVRWLV